MSITIVTAVKSIRFTIRSRHFVRPIVGKVLRLAYAEAAPCFIVTDNHGTISVDEV